MRLNAMVEDKKSEKIDSWKAFDLYAMKKLFQFTNCIGFNFLQN